MGILSQLYQKFNKLTLKLLWLLTAVGLIASMPLMMNRIEMESGANQVEFVFDYRDLLDISEYRASPDAYVREQLAKLKAAGVTAMAVYESTLDELELSGGIKLYSAEEASLLSGDDDEQLGNRTYVLFADTRAAAALEPLIIEGLGVFDVPVTDWSYNGKRGLMIGTSKLEAEMLPLDPDPLQLELLQEYGFRLSVRLSDARPYDHHRMDTLLAKLKEAGADTIIYAGKQVTGYASDRDQLALTSMAELLQKYGFRFAVIEQPLDKQQRGIGKLAELSGYQAVRLHSILEDEAFQDARTLADRYVLAVKDRNHRMIYLNARMRMDREQSQLATPLKNITDSLSDPNFGAIERLKQLGFEIGPPQPFKVVNPGWEPALKALVMLGAIALITRMVSYFLPAAAGFVASLGLIGTAGLYVLSPALCMQALALLASVSAPTAAVISGIRTARRRLEAGGGEGALRAFGYSIVLFVRTLLLSLVGAVYVIALLNHISYIYVIQQFRGVSVLHILPIGLVALYALFFYGSESFGQVVGRIRRFLFANIKVIWVVIGGITGVILMYYLSRTGNSGVVLPWDRAFRELLEQTLGVRPRTKELITLPLYILGIYWFVRYRWVPAALVLVTAGTMGMLSVVDTFAHLHTPLDISGLRVLFGACISAGLAFLYYAAWELLMRGWKRWGHMLLPRE